LQTDKLLLQGLSKTEDRDSLQLLPKSSSEPTNTPGAELTRIQRTEANSKESHAEQRFRPPVQQSSDTTVTDSASKFSASYIHWPSGGLLASFQLKPELAVCSDIYIY